MASLHYAQADMKLNGLHNAQADIEMDYLHYAQTDMEIDCIMLRLIWRLTAPCTG